MHMDKVRKSAWVCDLFVLILGNVEGSLGIQGMLYVYVYFFLGFCRYCLCPFECTGQV